MPRCDTVRASAFNTAHQRGSPAARVWRGPPLNACLHPPPRRRVRLRAQAPEDPARFRVEIHFSPGVVKHPLLSGDHLHTAPLVPLHKHLTCKQVEDTLDAAIGESREVVEYLAGWVGEWRRS